MPDAKLPPPDPDEVEDLEDPESDAAEPAVAGVGPALLTPPLPERDETEPDESGGPEEREHAEP